MNFSELQAEVRENVIDAPTVVVNAVPREINRAIRYAQDLYNFQVMEALWAPVIDPSTPMPQTPIDWKAPRGRPTALDLSVPGAGPTKLLSYAPLAQVQRGGNTSDSGFTSIIAVGLPNAQGIPSFSAYPDTYTQTQLYLPYWKYLPPLVAAGDQNWFTVAGEAWVIARATAQAFAKDWNENRAGYWKQQAAEEWLALKRADGVARFSGLNEMAVYSGVNDPRIGR